MNLLKTVLIGILLGTQTSYASEDLSSEEIIVKKQRRRAGSKDKLVVAYENFLTYAPLEVKTKFDSAYPLIDQKPRKINFESAHPTQYLKLPGIVIEPTVNVLIIRDLILDKVSFTFSDNIDAGITACYFQGKLKNKITTYWRSIVPRQFKSVPSMTLHEYIINGEKFNPTNEYKHTASSLKIYANIDPQKTPLRIILLRCTGTWFIDGLIQERIDQIFINKSPKLSLNLGLPPEKQ